MENNPHFALPVNSLSEEELLLSQQKACCKIIFWVSFVFNPVYGIFDYYMSPENWKLFFSIRIAHSLIIGIYYFWKFEKAKNIIAFQYFLFLGILLEISFMCNMVSEQALLNYLVGLIAIFPIASVVLIWELKHVVITTVIAMVAYFTMFFLFNPPYDLQYLFEHGGTTFISLAIMSIMIQSMRYNYLKQTINSKLLLDIALAKEQQTHLKLQVLSKQINPHYIFNILASIQYFIRKNDSQKALDFTHKYAILVRNSLHDESKEFVTLGRELEIINNFLELESIRHDNSFDYVIHIDDSIIANDLLVPSFLIQPFVENAIIHGISHLTNRRGKIEINIKQGGRYLDIEIIDNGVGRQQSKSINAQRKDHKSIGIINTQERIKILRDLYNVETQINITDLQHENTGTKVDLKITKIQMG